MSGRTILDARGRDAALSTDHHLAPVAAIRISPESRKRTRGDQGDRVGW